MSKARNSTDLAGITCLPMYVPLHKYPDMLSAKHISWLLGCHIQQAHRIMDDMNYIDISLGAGRYRAKRIPKDDLARRYNLKQSIRRVY